MRVVGTLFVLAACAAIQLPWFSCHSDCRQAFLPVWDLGVHHCHDESAHQASRHACACCPADESAPDRQAEEGLRAMEPDHDHSPGDHELQLRSSRRPASGETPTPDPTPAAFALVASAEIGVRARVTHEGPRRTVCDTGPPDRLASVRLLL